jgi:adenylate kinase
MVSFMGSPGSGKGTLAQKCIKKFNCASLSVGNVLREEIAKGTELGKKVECINTGRFAADELVIEVVDAWLHENMERFDTIILDGFPRTVKQADLFLNLLNTKFKTVSFKVVNLDATDETIMYRILNRLVCEKCQNTTSALRVHNKLLTCKKCEGNLIKREDDTKDIIKNRFNLYAKYSNELLDFYVKSQIHVDIINAEDKSPSKIFCELEKLLQ